MTRRTTPLLPETAVVTEAAQAELSPQGARPRKATARKAAAPKGAAPKGAAGAGAKSPAAKVEPARTPRRTAKPATESPGTLVTGEPSPAASKPQAAPKPRAAAKAVAAAGPAPKAAKAGVKPETAAPTVAAPVQPVVAAAPAPASPAAPAPPRVKEPPAAETPPGPINFEAFAGNLARLVEEGGKAMAAYLRPREEGRVKDDMAEEMADVMKTLGNVAEYWLADPQRAVEAQSRLVGGYLSLWSSTLKRLSGENVAPVAEPPTRDGRFADPEWSSNPFFDALKQTYLLTANWAEKLVDDAEIDTHTRHKAEFYVRQIAGAVSPSNFVLTNPELLRATFSSNGENLVRGMKMLAEDIEAGGGELKIRQTDTSKFQVGTNLAITPGKVIFQNELMQLIQYSPTTETVLKTPVVIVPPWINKFYILDLNPEKSFVRWAVAQGLTVFIVSWVNPDSSLAEKGFEEYMRDGVLKAVEVAKAAAGTEQVHTVGYCVGGTMLAMTLAWLTAGKGADKARAGKARRKAAGKASNAGAEMSDGIAAAGIASATFFTTQVDFKLAGDLKVFIDEEQVALLERRMLESGLMDGRVMANAFNMLRANDLIWPYVVNNYLKGQAPFPFDILYWNSDPTRMPRANHSFYLRNCYLDNKFARGELELAGERLDLSRVKLPIYSLATREDHIAPAVSVFRGLKFFGTRPRFVLAGSGHIAGVVNPPSRAKYQYWVGTEPGRDDDLESWIAAAQMHPGSWWPDWFAWLEDMDGARVPAREPGGGVFEPIEDAPGSYVKVKV